MSMATHPLSSRPRLTVAVPRSAREDAPRIEILENPLHRQDAALGAAVETELKRILAGESVGHVNVRFRVCRDESDAFRFICKVENPPRVDTEVMMPWRWWSPLLETADDFAVALEEGLRVRRARLSSASA
jgi:hypothetical protein